MITIRWHRGTLTGRACLYVCVRVLGIGSQYYNNDTHTHMSVVENKRNFFTVHYRCEHRMEFTTKVTVAVMAAAAAVPVAAVGQKMHVFVNNGPSPARFKIKARQNKSN